MHSGKEKKEAVRKMFDDISPKYDFLNHFLSFGIDKSWRRRLVRMLSSHHPKDILDVATGTGDLAIAISGIKPRRIVGIDISEGMLELGRQKLVRKGVDHMISFHCADAEDIPFEDESFDAVTVAFGVRNFANLELGIREMRRILRPGGRMYILEFSHPATFPMKQLYGIYSRFFIPSAGKIISGNSEAYQYLPDSVAAFPSGQRLVDIIRAQGMSDVAFVPLTMGIASIYTGRK